MGGLDSRYPLTSPSLPLFLACLCGCLACPRYAGAVPGDRVDTKETGRAHVASNPSIPGPGLPAGVGSAPPILFVSISFIFRFCCTQAFSWVVEGDLARLLLGPESAIFFSAVATFQMNE